MLQGEMLTPHDHNRVLAGFRYIYPVVSRRAGGLSVGVNLNLNNACNWRCVYCQVPNLQRGAPSPVEISAMETELAAMLEMIVHGRFLQDHVPVEVRHLSDIALAGNGEPTLCRQFPAAVEAVIRQVDAFGLRGKIHIVLISNGSMMHREDVQAALRQLAEAGGEVWLKIDRGTEEEIRKVNQVGQTPALIRRHVAQSVSCCPTWVQTCMFKWDGQPPSAREVDDYLGLLASLPGVAGVLLYGIAREPMLAEGAHVSALDAAWMEQLASRIRALGLEVKLFV